MNLKNILYSAVFGDSPEEGVDITKSELEEADIIQISDDTLHVIMDHKSRLIQVIHADYGAKQYVLRIDGKDITVKLRDEVESRVHAMGFDINRNHVKLKQVSSPMPGLVLKVLAKEGDELLEGQPVIVLEAMKMENVLKSPTSGKVTSVNVKEGQNVDKGQVLVELG